MTDAAKTCAYCGARAEGNYAIHSYGVGDGPEVDLCDEHGAHSTPTCEEIWARIASRQEIAVVDGVSIAENASSDSTWAPCGACRANRRLDDQGLCYECSPDPLKVELVKLRAEVASYQAEPCSRKHKRLDELQQLAESRGRAEAELHRDVSRLRNAHERARSRSREMREDLAKLQHLRGAHFVLPLTEAEHLVLVSVMVDVVAEDPDIPTLSIHRKLTAESP